MLPDAQECPLGISIGISIDIHHQRHHLEGLQIGLRYLQNPEIWSFWTYLQIHGIHGFGPFWHAKIPPVSSYSRQVIQISTHLVTPFGHPRWSPSPPTLYVVPYVPPHPPVCPSGHTPYVYPRYTIYRHPLRGSPGGSPEPSK